MDVEHGSRRRSFVATGHRTRRLVRRRERRRRLTFMSLGIGIVTLTLVFVAFGNRVPIFKGLSSVFSGVSSSQTGGGGSAGPKTKMTLLIVGEARGGDDSTATTELLVMLLDMERSKINGVTFSEKTFMEVPGHGFEKIAVALPLAPNVLKTAVGDGLGIEVDYFLKLTQVRYRQLIEEEDYAKLFDKPADTDIGDKELARIVEATARVDKDRVNVVPLPVEPIAVGTDTFYQLKKDEVDYLVEVFWGQTNRDGDKNARVIVLNGSGDPGAANQLAEKLTQNSFSIVAIRNADSFDHEETEIIIYEDQNDGDSWKQGQAASVKRVLKVGKIVTKEMDQEVADLAVLIGKDYAVQDG